jgi:RimJ/RimL family protein N-acetyltransferase
VKAVWLHRDDAAFAPVEAFISAKIWGKPRDMPGDTIIVSVDGKGDAQGAAIFQNYDAKHDTIEISAAGIASRWLSRAVLFEMFAYPFNQLGCQAVVLQCDPADAIMARIAGAYGFKRYDIPHLRTLYVLSADDWRANGFHKENK